jgi:hypothetical protein
LLLGLWSIIAEQSALRIRALERKIKAELLHEVAKNFSLLSVAGLQYMAL